MKFLFVHLVRYTKPVRFLVPAIILIMELTISSPSPLRGQVLPISDPLGVLLYSVHSVECFSIVDEPSPYTQSVFRSLAAIGSLRLHGYPLLSSVSFSNHGFVFRLAVVTQL